MIQTMQKLVQRHWGMFLQGAWVTLYTSFFSVLLGTLFGSFFCLMRLSKIKPLRWISATYIEIIRGTPLMLQLWFFTLLPTAMGFELPLYTCVLFALVVNSSAYVAELIRSGIQSVDPGQAEAARSLGLSGSQTMLRIVLPQAVRNILPALGNEFVMIIKETSLLSVFMIGDLMTVNSLLKAAYYLTLESLIIVAIIYFVLTFTLSKLVAAFERRMARSD